MIQQEGALFLRATLLPTYTERQKFSHTTADDFTLGTDSIINAKDRSDKTLLDYALEKSDEDLVKKCIALGCDVNISV